MKVRLYRYPGAWTVDQFTLYFPYPKWLREHDGVHGCFVGCNQASDGSVIRCNWDYDDRKLGYHPSNLGRRYPLERMSKQFRKWANRMARLWNDALRYDDEKHWDKWNAA